MATKFDFSAFNGEIFNSKKSLTATEHRTAHGAICRFIQVRNKETFFSISACVAYTKTIIRKIDYFFL